MTGAPVLGRIASLVGSFNEGSLDVPADLFDRACVFRLNGVAYEDTLGRPLSDPLVRLVARGPAAYRLLAQALRYAVPDARVEVDALAASGGTAGDLVTARARLTGALRGGQPIAAGADLAVVVDARSRVTEVAAIVDEPVLASIAEARQR